MMIFRLTRKAATKLHLPKGWNAAGGEEPTLTEWYCNVVPVQRRQLFLFTHARSLFSFWHPAAGVNKWEGFVRLFRQTAREVLADYRFPERDIQRLMNEGPDIAAKTVDRGVLGSMVDYAKLLQYAVEDAGGLDRLSPRERNDIANECPMSKIDAHPDDYLRRLLSGDAF
jgi:hypothetical protein